MTRLSSAKLCSPEAWFVGGKMLRCSLGTSSFHRQISAQNETSQVGFCLSQKWYAAFQCAYHNEGKRYDNRSGERMGHIA